MLTYLYIALGGAIGSVARAWTANAAVRLLGPHFPWGTIFINISGSFVIGLFAALTASEGRFSANPDARAFVMIGICGGFTTFSSFSLQTLDLARDGKLGAAFANIALSVILCLVAVTAGYASAEVINRGAPQAEALGAKANGGVVLAVLDRPENVASVLSNAARLLSFWGGKPTLEALAVRNPPVAELMEADQAVTHSQEASLQSLGGSVGARGDGHGAALGGASAAARANQIHRNRRRYRSSCGPAWAHFQRRRIGQRARARQDARRAARGTIRYVAPGADRAAGKQG